MTPRKTRGRPVDTREKYVVRLTLVLNRGEDDDLIGLYERTPPGQKARVTLMAMRAGGVQTVTEQVKVDDRELADAVGSFLY